MDDDPTCHYCGDAISSYSIMFECPTCGREGTEECCMPAGHGCMCPECEENED